MFELKVEVSYIRLYRDSLGNWVTALAALKAIASCAGIAAWVIWKEYAFIWGAIIAASQVADALKDVFPFAKRHRAAASLAGILENLFIDVQLELEYVFAGQYSDEEIMNRLHQLRKLQLEFERRYFPDGLTMKAALLNRAKQEAAGYLESMNVVNCLQGTTDG